MSTHTANSPYDGPPPGLSPLAAADLQDHLLIAANDLARLQRLLGDASQALTGHFYAAASELKQLLRAAARHPEVDTRQIHAAMDHLAGAITAMQFEDMASQLVDHTGRRLRNCADRLAVDAMGSDDEDGTAVVEAAPLRPNPVTQDEVDAGSIELF